MRQSLASGFSLGLLSGLGASLAHAAFATLALFGAGEIAGLLADWWPELRVISTIMLLVIGVRTALRPVTSLSVDSGGERLHAVAATLGLALSNPMTILPYMAAASALAGSRADNLWIIPGASLGAAACYALISAAVRLMRPSIITIILPRLNAAAGVALIGFGVVTAFR